MTYKAAALAMVAALLAQPLLAAFDCGFGSTPADPCCPTSSAPSQNRPGTGEPANPDCCEITSSEPGPWATPTKSSQSSRVSLVLPASSGEVVAGLEAAPAVAQASPPRAPTSPLHTLYCVFLI